MRRLILLLLLAGCDSRTGLMLEVTMPEGVSSTEKGIATLELVVAEPSFCERWVEDQSASHTKVDVSKRDLLTQPYSFLVEPVQATDIHAQVVPIVLARDANGQLLGEAGFGELSWGVGEVRRDREAIFLLKRGSHSDGPRYLTDDGCVCLPGEPWLATGSGTGCDPNVITNFDRLADTRGCELPARAGLPVACDGQQYPNEVTNRQLPCFATVNGVCRVDTRNCTDQGGFAYDQECIPGDTDPALPDTKLCDAYLACERNACGDVIGCFSETFPQRLQIGCTLRIALTNDGVMHPCGDGEWTALLSQSADACPAALLDGVGRPPFLVGFRDPNVSGVQPLVGECPLVLGVDEIEASNYDDVPYSLDMLATIKNQLVNVHIDVQIGCIDGPSLICQ